MNKATIAIANHTERKELVIQFDMKSLNYTFNDGVLSVVTYPLQWEHPDFISDITNDMGDKDAKALHNEITTLIQERVLVSALTKLIIK